MRATSTAAGTGLSDCYKWIPAKDVDATKTACAGAPPPPPPQPTITFSSVKGNEHWFEAVIKGDEPIGPAWLYFNDCTNEPSDLSYRADWGKWVTGVSIPSGTKVVIEAYGAHGPQRSGGYVWPNATPTSGCPP
jgi:hypothetical protein